MSNVSNLTNNLVNSTAGPKSVEVEGMGKSEEHNPKDQLAILAALGSAACGRRAGILRTPIRVGSPTGLRFPPQGEFGR